MPRRSNSTPGSVTALIGPNGSGKSTLLRALARLHPPVADDVTFADGADLRALSGRDLARRITPLSQQRTAPGGLSVRELVEFGRHPHRSRWGGRDPEGPTAVERAITLTGLTAIADRPVQALSGGQAQRIRLASCLAQDTALLLIVLARNIRMTTTTAESAGTHLGTPRFRLVLGVLITLAAGATMGSVLLGDTALLIGDVLTWLTGQAGPIVTAVMENRAPRVAAALLAGTSLALAGAVIRP